MKEDKKSNSWKNELLNGLGEVIIAVVAIGIGLGVAFLFPYEAINEFPAELFFVLGGIVVLAVLGVFAWILHVIRRRK